MKELNKWQLEMGHVLVYTMPSPPLLPPRIVPSRISSMGGSSKSRNLMSSKLHQHNFETHSVANWKPMQDLGGTGKSSEYVDQAASRQAMQVWKRSASKRDFKNSHQHAFKLYNMFRQFVHQPLLGQRSYNKILYMNENKYDCSRETYDINSSEVFNRGRG